MNEASPPVPRRRAALAFVLVTVTLDMLALGIVIPVLPQLVKQFLGGDTAHAAQIYGLFGTAGAAMQFLFSPLLGALSDRFGRRPVILLSNVGLGLDYVLMALSPTLSWLFLGRLISGITAASVPTAGAYIADVTAADETRSAGFGLMGGALGIGFVLGPAVGGALGGTDPRLPFWVAAALSLINALYGLFVLPESLPKERRAAFSWRRANTVGSLRLLRTHPELLGLSVVRFLARLSHDVLRSVFVLYGAYRYGWGQPSTGLFLAAVGVCMMIVSGGVVRPFVTHFGERRALLTGLLFGAAGFAILGSAQTGGIALLAVPVQALWGLSGPASQGLMTRRVSGSEQGQLQGAQTSLDGIAGMIGPSLFTLTFAHFIDPHADPQIPGAPFLLAACLLVGAALIAMRVTKPIVQPATP